MTRRAHQRSIWAGSDRQSQAFHKARLFSAVRVVCDFVLSVESIGQGEGRWRKGFLMAARQAAEEAKLYIDDGRDE